jgi:aromatic ring-opening dioxygenase LigB subunit
LERVRAASREVARALDGILVVVSPHSRGTGVYTSTRGGLRCFGVPRADAAYAVDRDVSARVASGWGRSTLEGPLDHGVVVPLELLGWSGRLVAIGLAEDEPDLPEAALSLTRALTELPEWHEMSVVASVNGGAGVIPRGPLTELPRGRSLEEELSAALEGDVASLTSLAPRLATDAGSCSLGPLLVFAHLFAGASVRLLAHEWPYGVGYPVALVEGSP